MTALLTLVSLPSELKRRLASFLNADDALSLELSCHAVRKSRERTTSRASHIHRERPSGVGVQLVFPLSHTISRQIHKALSLATLPPRDFLESFHALGKVATGDTPQRAVAWIPILYPGRHVHSVRLCINWYDQGWGNRKGQVYVVERAQVPENHRRFQGGTAVYESPRAPHEPQRLKIVWSPREGATYDLWSKVGGGGGHQLTLQQGRSQVLIYDDDERNYSRNFNLLVTPNVLQGRFYPCLLKAVCQSLRQQLVHSMPLDETLKAFLEEWHLSVTERSLQAMEDIVDDVGQYKAQLAEEVAVFQEELTSYQEEAEPQLRPGGLERDQQAAMEMQPHQVALFREFIRGMGLPFPGGEGERMVGIQAAGFVPMPFFPLPPHPGDDDDDMDADRMSDAD